MFTQLLTDLNDIGLTDTEVALSVQASQPTITRLRNGDVKEPMHALGARIVDFHNRKMKEAALKKEAA